jgi:transposase
VSAPRTDMHRPQELVRLYRMGVGVRERTRALRMGTHTEAQYRRIFEAAGLLEGEPEAVPELAALRAAVDAALPAPAPRVPVSSAEPWMAEIEAALKRGAGPTAIWDRLRRLDPEFNVSVSAVKRVARRLARQSPVRAEDVVIAVETEPGAVAQVDFGYAGWFFDPGTGRRRKAWVFAMVLGYSRHMFARLVWDQKSTTWVQLHVEAFKWFGGVPCTVVPDNLKAAVTRAAFGVTDRDNLALNRTYRELARYYGFKIDPAPPYQPEKKGKIESGVKYLKRNFLAAGGFETVHEANADLPDWLLRTAGERMHGATRRAAGGAVRPRARDLAAAPPRAL